MIEIANRYENNMMEHVKAVLQKTCRKRMNPLHPMLRLELALVFLEEERVMQ